MKRRIVLLGPPACGKGTQAEMIHQRFGYPLASPGSMLREEMKAGTELGKQAHALTSQGHLVPDKVVVGVMENWLLHQAGTFVFDGFPRTIGQAEGLEPVLVERELPIELVLGFEATEDVLRQRMAGRLVCSGCSRSFSAQLHGAALGGSCPVCGGAFGRRPDDSEEAFDVRMAEYREKTVPLFDYYNGRGVLRSLAAEADPADVFAKVCELLEKP